MAALHEQKTCSKSIAKQVKRSKDVALDLIKAGRSYRRAERSERPSKMTIQDRLALIGEDSKGQKNARQLDNELKLSVAVSRVQQVLSGSDSLHYQKMAWVPAVKKRHRLERIKWATGRWLWQLQDWFKVVFNEEKKFNLDGPESFAYYLHGIRKRKRPFLSIRADEDR